MMIKMLQTTAATSAKVLAGWLDTMLRLGQNLSCATFIVIAFLIDKPKFNLLGGQRAFNKAGLAIDTPNTSTVVTEVDNIALERLLVIHDITLVLCEALVS
jgi:hypothetical protein